MKYKDTVKLGMGHNLILGNTPDNLDLAIFAHGPVHRVNNNVESFGLFDASSPNYNTYYPNVTAEDLKPKSEDFIEPTFRALSEVIVRKATNPIDFSMNNVLKKSMGLLVGQTVNVDHETMASNAMGAVKLAFWDAAYTTSGGIKVPAGINTILKLDGKSNPRQARGIMMDPPSIHSTSVTVQFLWEKSHPSMSEEEFFHKLGTFDKDKNLIRRIVSDIQKYNEISLVAHGADPYAQKINDKGQINNPQYANKTYFDKFAENSLEDKKANKTLYYFFDCKTELSGAEDTEETILEETILENSNKNTMNKELQAALTNLAIVLGLAAKPDTEEYSLAEISTAAAKLRNDNLAHKDYDAIKAELTELKKSTDPLAAARVLSLENFQKQQKKALADEAVNNYKLSKTGGTVDENVITMLSAETTAFETLALLNTQYKDSLDATVPLHCAKCGSKEVTRKSSASHQADSGDEEITLSAKEALDKELKKISKQGSFSLYELEENKK